MEERLIISVCMNETKAFSERLKQDYQNTVINIRFIFKKKNCGKNI